ncbi:MAG: ZIP family metal transporter [Christensenellaceae bacterium]|nr:ZIP family metal transporter [Christensenellaceae bacterium]
MLNVIIGMFIPFIGTMLGSAMVFFMKKQMNEKLQNGLSGFASGVMIAASIWSLIIPGLNMAEEQGSNIPWLPVALGFLAGVFFLLLIDKLTPHIHAASEEAEGPKANLKKNTMLLLSVTIHNIPEGMAVGVVLAGLLNNNSSITLASALALSIGIAIQNFPEGAIISMPLYSSSDMSKTKAFIYGALSGIVEPIAAFITILLTNVISGMLPFLLAFAAGAMIYVVVEELVPESHGGNHDDTATIFLSLGFVIMMILDVALG